MRIDQKHKENQMVVKKRKIVKTGNSFYVALPQEYIKKYHLSPGDELAVVLTKEGNLKVMH